MDDLTREAIAALRRIRAIAYIHWVLDNNYGDPTIVNGRTRTYMQDAVNN